jgi:hypothetical protein
MDDAIETYCACGWVGMRPLGDYCPRCGGGPALPSEDRVDRFSGKPEAPATDLYTRTFRWQFTRPARQSIPIRGSRVGGRPTVGPEAVPSEPGAPRRSRTLADPTRAFWEALAAVRASETRLTQKAVATQMGIDRGTLRQYIADGLVPEKPWEGLRPPSARDSGA